MVSARHGIPQAIRDENSELLRTKYGGQFVDEYMIMKKDHGVESITKSCRKKWKCLSSSFDQGTNKGLKYKFLFLLNYIGNQKCSATMYA